MLTNKLWLNLLFTCSIALIGCNKQETNISSHTEQDNDKISTANIQSEIDTTLTKSDTLPMQLQGNYQKLVNVLGEWQNMQDSVLTLTASQIDLNRLKTEVSKWQTNQTTIIALDKQQRVILKLQLKDSIWVDLLQNKLYAYKKIQSN